MPSYFDALLKKKVGEKELLTQLINRSRISEIFVIITRRVSPSGQRRRIHLRQPTAKLFFPRVFHTLCVCVCVCVCVE